MGRVLLVVAIVFTAAACSNDDEGSTPPASGASLPSSTSEIRLTTDAVPQSTATIDSPPIIPPSSSAPTTSTAAVGVEIALPYEAGSVAASGGSIWVIPHRNEVVLRVDPTTNQVVQEIALPGVVGAEIDADADTVWMSVSTPESFAPAGVVRLDAATGSITGPFTIDGVDGVLQVWGIGAVNLVALDVNSHALSRTVDLPDGIMPCPDGAVSESVLWLVAASGGTCGDSSSALIGIDTATGNVVRHQPLPFAPEYGMDVSPDDVWMPVIRQPRIVRVSKET